MDILTACPGRLLDLFRKGIITLENVRLMIVDEADKMLDMGFEPQINEIVHDTNLPSSPQKVLSSATFPTDVLSLANRFMGGP